MDYTISYRPNRKTLCLQVSPTNQVRVLVPVGVTDSQIDAFVQAKQSWLKRVMDRQAERQANRLTYTDGETVWYLGRSLTLRVSSVDSAIVLMADTLIIPNAIDRRRMVIDWYVDRADEIIPDRVECYAESMSVRPNQVRIKSQRTKWGSCSSLGNIALNWRLIMAPMPVLDYVVVHELCHLMHMDHSTRFWQAVESVMPRYKEHRRWLKDHGYMLDLI